MVSITPSSRSLVNCLLTVSIVKPRLSEISRRDIGKSLGTNTLCHVEQENGKPLGSGLASQGDDLFATATE